jgi:hypothetical protein
METGDQMEKNVMRSLLLISCTAATAFATAIVFAPHRAQAMTIATPAGLSAAIQQSDVKENVYWRRRAYWGYSYYRPYAYRPYAYPYYSYYRPYRPWLGRGYYRRGWWW